MVGYFVNKNWKNWDICKKQRYLKCSVNHNSNNVPATRGVLRTSSNIWDHALKGSSAQPKGVTWNLFDIYHSPESASGCSRPKYSLAKQISWFNPKKRSFMFKRYLCYKTVYSQNVSCKAQGNNFFIFDKN